MKCPVCGCDNHCSVFGGDTRVYDDEVIIENTFICTNCESLWTDTDRYEIRDFISGDREITYEGHADNFGESEISS